MTTAGPRAAVVATPPSVGQRVWAVRPWRQDRFGRAGYWATVIVACALSGILYETLAARGRPLLGATYGGCIGGAVMLFEQGVILPGLRERLRLWPWLAGVLAAEAIYVALVLVSGGVTGAVLWTAGLTGATLRQAMLMDPVTLLYSLIASGLVITLSRMRDLIGPTAFRNVLVGRYHRPVEEERIFLFIDLIGSTAYAQAHGDLRAQGFLGAIYAALAAPVREHGGEIDDYVGDMALVTWTMREGVSQARCVACVFAFFDAIAANAERWRRDFGEVPRFRAALHGGSVVTAEIGVDRHKISYFGDVVNTTGRLEALCRTLDVPVLISADLCDRLGGLPQGVVSRPLGAHDLKGRGQLLQVLAVEREQPRATKAA